MTVRIDQKEGGGVWSWWVVMGPESRQSLWAGKEGAIKKLGGQVSWTCRATERGREVGRGVEGLRMTLSVGRNTWLGPLEEEQSVGRV